MNDYFNIPQITNHYTFFALGSTVWQTWQKPKNCNFIYITAIGGGGGGGGSSQSSSVSVGGGSGGGCSSLSKILIPSVLIPDILYINVGVGGQGGFNAAGSTGGLSTISVEPNALSNNVIIKSGTIGAGGGGRGTTSSAGAAGTGGTAFISSQGFLSSLGNWSSSNGISGAVGGAPGFNAGGTVLALNTFVLTGGGGGGGRSTANGAAGGSILANGVLGRVAGGTTASDGGKGTVTILPNLLTNSSTEFPFAATGGSGGGGAPNGSSGGSGGEGEIGCGGGGAGGGEEGAGSGGNGGNGIVFITVF